jgi:hypothetical protein
MLEGVMNLKRCGRKHSWFNQKYYSWICLEGLKKRNKKNLRTVGVLTE